MVLFVIFLEPKGTLIADSFLNLVIQPTQTFYSLFYSWNNGLFFGYASNSGHAYIFPFSFAYYFFTQFFEISTTQTIIFALILWTGFYSFTKFIQNELNDNSYCTYIGGAFYIFNMYTLTNFAGASSMLLPYVFLPLQLYFLNKILLSQDYFKYSFGLSVATLFMSGINPPLIAINLVVMSIYMFHLVTQHNLINRYKLVFKKLIISFFLVSLINSYWITSLLSFFFGGSADMGAILSEPLSMQNQASSYQNVFRTLGLWAFGQGWDGKPYYNFSPNYLGKTVFILSMYLLPIIALSSLLFTKKVKEIYWVLFLIVLSIPMVVATNQGIFANLYEWAYYNVPLFSMFRSNYKFIQVYIFSLAILLVYLLKNIKDINIKKGLSVILISLIILNAYPFFTGDVFENEKKIQEIPSYYYDAQDFFNEDKSAYRIFLLPVQYFAVFDWGNTYGNPELIWNNGLVSRQAGSEFEKSNNITLRLYDHILNKDYENANILFKELNVKYIVQRNDFNWKYYSSISQSPETIENVLTPYEKIETFGKLDIYKIPDCYMNPLFESNYILFKKINPIKYRLYLKDIESEQTVYFLESFDENWKLYLMKSPTESWCEPLKRYNSTQTVECHATQVFYEGDELSYLWNEPIFDDTHQTAYGYSNSWTIDPEYIKTNYPKEYYTENKDGSIEIEMVLYFKPQSYFYVSVLTSVTTLIICIIYLFICMWKSRNKTKWDYM